MHDNSPVSDESLPFLGEATHPGSVNGSSSAGAESSCGREDSRANMMAVILKLFQSCMAEMGKIWRVLSLSQNNFICVWWSVGHHACRPSKKISMIASFWPQSAF